MALELTSRRSRSQSIAAAVVIARAAAGLLVNALIRPGQPARIERGTGRVVVR